MRAISQLAVNRLTKPWEEFVAYPYDDKVPKRRDQATGKLAYPEYKGGPVRGTITQGYGHTDAAGAPKIVLGQQWTEGYACQVLANDMRPCCTAVERLITVPLGQHQFDTLADFVFNAGEGTLQKSTFRKKLNAGDYDCVPDELMKFVFSKGERMRGLENRRRAEISMWRTPDDKPETARAAPADLGVHDDDVMVPKADLPPTRSPLDSKTVTAGGSMVGTGVAIAAKALDGANQAAQPLQQAKDNLQQLGLWDSLVNAATHIPLGQLALVGGAVVAVLGVFVVWDRWRHLHAEAR